MLGALAGALLALGPWVTARAQAFFPSPADWRDVVLYQIVTDRFANGDPSNDAVEGSFDPSNGFLIHGGDFAGLEAKLDYLQTLGVGAVWISPVPLNANAEYHGYAARDLRTIAPHFGGLAALQSFVQAAHARGIYVILDVVCNHMGDLIGSFTPGYPSYQPDPSPYVLSWWNASKRHAAPFDDLSWYHNNGSIGSFTDPEQILGELFGLDDLRTELPAVRDALVDAFTWLIEATDCDGFRVDTVKHVELGFWQDWVPRVRAFADSIGKSNFLFFGEVFDGSDFKNGIYTGTQAGGAYAFNSMLYYPMYFTTNDVFAFGSAGTSAISSRYAAQGFYDPTVRDVLVRFLDNHDVPRFMAQAGGDTLRLQAALAFHLTSQGVPIVYYGTEQAFDGGNDPADREDMFDGAWEFGPSLGDDFDEASPLFTWTQRLIALRRAYPALRRGTQVERLAVGSPGIYAFSRIDGAQEVLVVVNSSAGPTSANNLQTTWTSGTALVDLLDSTRTAVVEPLGTVDVALAGHGAAILVRASDVVPLAPVVIDAVPAHDGFVGWRDAAVRVRFSQPMDRSSVEVRWSLAPAVPGFFRWVDDATVEFHPTGTGWAAGADYALRIEAGARDQVSPPQTLAAPYEQIFHVDGGAPVLTVASGYEAMTWASAGLAAPEGIEFPGGAFGGFCYVGDEGLGNVLAFDAQGAAAPFATPGTLGKPEGLAWDAAGTYGGGILVADQNGVFKLDAGGGLTAFLPGSSETVTGWIGIDAAGAFGGRLHLGSNDANWIRSYDPSGVPATLATGILGFEAAAFGPGGAWGTDLYVADPDLTAFFGGIDGSGAILRVTPGGVVTTFAAAGALTAGIAALAFDPVGNFGGDLFGADVAQERVLRIDAAGQVSVFASGFGNLFGSDCLGFDAAGDLYVVDTGSGQPFTDTSGGAALPRIVRFRPVAASDAGGAPRAAAVRLLPNVPNPFNPSTTLWFELPRSARVQLDVLDVRGRRVRRLLDAERGTGKHRVRWDGRDAGGAAVGSGVYVVRLRAGGGNPGGRIVTRRITLVR